MISLLPLIKHLEKQPDDFKGIWFRRVDTADDMAMIEPEHLPLPACWIVRGPEKSKHAGSRRENVTFSISIVIGIENARNHQPGETDEMMLTYRKAVKNLLLGEDVSEDIQDLNYDGGQPAGITGRDIYWADTYSFAALVTNYKSPPQKPYPEIEWEEQQPESGERKSENG